MTLRQIKKSTDIISKIIDKVNNRPKMKFVASSHFKIRWRERFVGEWRKLWYQDLLHCWDDDDGKVFWYKKQDAVLIVAKVPEANGKYKVLTCYPDLKKKIRRTS